MTEGTQLRGGVFVGLLDKSHTCRITAQNACSSTNSQYIVYSVWDIYILYIYIYNYANSEYAVGAHLHAVDDDKDDSLLAQGQRVVAIREHHAQQLVVVQLVQAQVPPCMHGTRKRVAK
jgi:hypothetical protein